MCLAIPGRVVELYEENGLRMGKIDFQGIARQACLEHVPEATIDDYVLVHVGFALSVVDEDEANRVFAYLREMEELDELEAP